MGTLEVNAVIIHGETPGNYRRNSTMSLRSGLAVDDINLLFAQKDDNVLSSLIVPTSGMIKIVFYVSEHSSYRRARLVASELGLNPPPEAKLIPIHQSIELFL